MSTIIVATILIGLIVSICAVLISIANKQKKKNMNRLLNRFSDLAIQNDLTFSSQEVLSDAIIGIDGLKKKLLIIDGIHDLSGESIIDLNKVTRCTVRKNYLTTNNQTSKNPFTYLQELVLNFEHSEGDLFSIPFYKNTNNHIHELPQLEMKAKHWETMLTKMIRTG